MTNFILGSLSKQNLKHSSYVLGGFGWFVANIAMNNLFLDRVVSI